MSYNRSQLSLKLLKTLEEIEEAEESNKNNNFMLQSLHLNQVDVEDEPTDVVRTGSSHVTATCSKKSLKFPADHPTTGKTTSLRAINNNRTTSFHHTEDESRVTRDHHKRIVTEQQSDNVLASHTDYHIDHYDDSLSLVTQQLKSIQETQDVILAELRMDIEQLNADNLALRLSNENLAKQVDNLRRIIKDFTKSTRTLREHIEDEIEITESNAHLVKSSQLLHRSSDHEVKMSISTTRTPQGSCRRERERERENETNFYSSNNENSCEASSPVSELENLSRRPSKSKKKQRHSSSRDTRREEENEVQDNNDSHNNRSIKNDKNTEDNNNHNNSNGGSGEKKSRRRCFEFLRRTKKIREEQNDNDIDNDTFYSTKQETQ